MAEHATPWVLTYKDHCGKVAWSEAEQAYVGRVLGAFGATSFCGETPEAAEQAFRDVVEEMIK